MTDEVFTYVASDPEGRFKGLPLKVEYVDGAIWRLCSDVTYTLADGRPSTVRAGFEFDFASVPRPLWWLFPPHGVKGNPYGIAALWHDWLCAHRKIAGQPVGFSEANRVFLEIMLYTKVRRTIAYTMYAAVQSPVGWLAWKNRKPGDMVP